MTDHDMLSNISMHHNKRIFSFDCTAQCSIDQKIMAANISSNHIIPADETVRAILESLQPGQFVNLTGYLVNMTNPNSGERWLTSLSRTDTGPEAAEIFWIETARVPDVK